MCRIHNFHFHPIPVLCPCCRCSRSCTRTTDPVPELQILYQKYKDVQDTQFPFSSNTSTVSVLQMQQILYQNYRSCTRTTDPVPEIQRCAGNILSIFTQDQYCARVADAADPVPELQGGQGIVQAHTEEQGGGKGGHSAPCQGSHLPVPHLQLLPLR